MHPLASMFPDCIVAVGRLYAGSLFCLNMFLYTYKLWVNVRGYVEHVRFKAMD